MMTIPMDSAVDHLSREQVQRLYNKNVELENKRRKAAQARVPSDPSAWQQMRENYEAIILEDNAFSEQHEIEYALWQLHYRRIEELRAHFNAAVNSSVSTNSQNGKVPHRSGPDRVTKIRTQFKTFLSEATGFYHDLMLNIRAKYGLPLGLFSDDQENQIPSSKDGNKSVEVKKGLISCHSCLIYLGDLARYKGLYGVGDSKACDFAAASCYYLQASSLWPSSGNPHHQLAILASYSNDELVAIYRYFRSLAVESPFATARDNLIIAFEKNRQCYSQLVGDTKASSTKAVRPRTTGKGRSKGETRHPLKDGRVEASSVQEKGSSMSDIFKTFSTRFVRLNGILFTRTSLETFGEVQSVVKNDLLELLSSGTDEKYNFGSDTADCKLAFVRLVAILIFTVHNVNKESENQSYAEILQRSVLLQNAFTAVFEFMGHVVERCVQLNDPTTSFLLPGVLVFVEWLASRQDVALGNEPEEKQTRARSFFWKNYIAFFNKLLSSGFKFVAYDKDDACFFNMSRYDEGESDNRLALPEDFELRGFIPFLPAQLILDFSRKHSFGGDGGIKEKKSRLRRIIAAGKALANVVRVGEEGIYFDGRAKKFILGIDPQVSDDYALNCSMEVPKLSGIELENSAAGQLTVGALQPKQQLYVEGEEEDEVIVFKPSVVEKHVNGSASNMMTSEGHVSGVSAASVPPAVSVASVGLGKEMGPFSAALDGLIMQSALHASARPPSSIANNSGQYMQPIQPSALLWSVERAAVMNGFGSLNMIRNGPAIISELQDQVFPPMPYSVPFPQSFNFGMTNNIPVHIPDAAIPSNFSSLSSSVVGIHSMSIKSPSVMSTGIRKNPVSRPNRHLGPPPGFGSVPSKVLEESSSAMTIKNEHTTLPPMDDYSWLAGYQLPSSHQSIGFNNSINHSTQNYHSMSKSSSSVGMVSFPFPGKQVNSLHVQSGNRRGWEDYQISEQLKLYQEQPQQLQSGNQQSVELPQRHEGQSLWEGRFFV
ncbi:nonsense-mediated mRNA decay factor SMG7-like isoform X1 [Nicotiana tomentosiformis]|uniref:nonsense-mediated mRNA decay factor SMG7-like isoform X1 n=1 Tax=Nicotiana tomentosiformis TaxID=4098 RepID=UPI00051C2B07|nr:protein SMG7-like isoform X1 [Nicotiana tomentosiformis]XP_033509310.1 protein SMG7-like isoform X1 [Nicotiana tomentosiformis]XP_033509315.1 protein SMG7-like isoform X1 [Nicotiana tomentosiformis]